MPAKEKETHPNLEQGQIPGMEEATTAKIKLIQCENLFSGVSPIKKRYAERAAQQGEKFNLFKILNIHADEVRLHSRFLAENGNYLLVNDIQEALTLLKITSLEKLMVELFQALKDHFKLSDGDVFFMDKTTKIEQHKLNELIQHYCQKNKVSQFGICLRLHDTAAPNLAFKVELHHSLYYGFAVVSGQDELLPWNDTHTKFPETFAKIKALAIDFSSKDNPFLYLKVVAESDKIYIHPDLINAEGLNILINKTARQQWIETFVEGIKEVIELVVQNQSRQ